MADRTFSEDQIQSLLKRATELHLMDEVDKPGLTLRDLEHIAADAGVPPKYLRAALHEADHQVSTRDVAGQTKTHVYIERTVPGELTDSEWEAVVYRLRKAYSSDLAQAYGATGQHGRGITEELGTAREWRHASSLGVVTTLAIRSAEGNQHITLQRLVGIASPRAEGIAYGLIAALIAGLVAGVVLESVLGVVLVFMAALALAAPSIEFLDRRWRDKTLREMKVVADDIQRIIINKSDLDEEEAASVIDAKDQFLEIDEPQEESSDPRRLDQTKDQLSRPLKH